MKGEKMETIDREALIRRVAHEADFTIQDVKTIFTTIENIVDETILNCGRVKWHGFCTAYVKKTAAYEGRNPATGERGIIPEKYRVYIRPSQKFTNILNQKFERKPKGTMTDDN